MPGKWVGGKGSVASPTKDVILEGKTVSDDGAPQGTVLVRVKRIYVGPLLPGRLHQRFPQKLQSVGRLETPGVDHRRVRCYQRSAQPPASTILHCTSANGESGRKQLMSGQAPKGYNREAKGLIAHYFKQEGAARLKPLEGGSLGQGRGCST